MTTVFRFTDFRSYLKEYYKKKKEKSPHFTIRSFAKKTGLDYRSLIDIINGTKRLSLTGTRKLSRTLGHDAEEKEYFIVMVAYTQAKDAEHRDGLYKRMKEIKRLKSAGIRFIGHDKMAFYAKWYHSAVRSIIDLYQFKDDYGGLARMLSPPITGGQVRRSIRLLERLGLIFRNANGIFHIVDRNIQTSSEIPETVKNRFHGEFTGLAKRSLVNVSPGHHKAVSITLGISRQTYERISDETDEFIQKICTMANNDRQADRVYQYQLLLFPLSVKVQSRGKKV